MKPQFKQFPWYMLNGSDSAHSTQWSQDELAAICQEKKMFSLLNDNWCILID